MSPPLKVAIIGSGNWGSVIAIIIGKNVQKYDKYDKTVKMYVFEEVINGKKLTDIINNDHENVKYLPGHKFTPNVVAVPDVVETSNGADILVFVLPHQFIGHTLNALDGKVKSSAIAISLIKGVESTPEGIELISDRIKNKLKVPVSVLMGANLAHEVADKKFCETTIGSRSTEHGQTFKELIQTDYFRITVVDDVETVEICGALKNVVACAAGFVDGLKCGDNTKAAVIRLGLMEMVKFADVFYKGSKLSTFFESCGVADLITTCYGGRNRKVSEAFVLTGKTIAELEAEMLNGQRLQGPETALDVNSMLKKKNMEDKFPLFTAVHRICIGAIPPAELIESLKQHPEHLSGMEYQLGRGDTVIEG
uniref:Glycerol-3-phosphate dehydrogenase [NAD(+)] n=1 Tax=Scolopendra viridis TaxID=118503 RepID=A0A4D5RAM0_SCOVI